MKRFAALLSALLLGTVPSCGEKTDIPVRSVAPLGNAQDTIRVVAVQMEIDQAFLDSGHDPVDALLPHIEMAGRDRADLLVFPEYLLGDFKVPGPLVDKLCQAAAVHRVNLIVGGWRTLPGHAIAYPKVPKTYANTALVIARDGSIAGMHDKMHAAVGAHSPYCWPPEAGEIGEWAMAWGGAPEVIALDFGRVGVLTCYDGFFFPSFEVPSLKGAEVLVWINGRGGSLEEHIVRTASFMTATHVIACNLACGFGTMICEHPGNIRSFVEKPGEQRITAELDMKALRVQRKNHRMLHQRRPEIYGDLLTNWEPWAAYPDIEFYQSPEKEATAQEPTP